MRFSFDKAACQNTRRALHREWLLANERGDCSGSSILCCNTRKYHGLLIVNTPHGRHVLLSALEESVCGGDREFFFSTRQHPGTLYPNGHEYLEAFQLDQWPQSTYRVGEVSLSREVLLARDKSLLYKALHYFGVILVFALGAGVGTQCVAVLGAKTIWLSCALLAVSLCLMFIKEELEG